MMLCMEKIVSIGLFPLNFLISIWFYIVINRCEKVLSDESSFK